MSESGKSAIREGRHGDTNCKHEVIHDHMKKSRLITLDVITLGLIDTYVKRNKLTLISNC